MSVFRGNWIVLCAMFAYCVATWASIEYVNASLRPAPMLQSYYEEYAGGGSRKWRGPAGNFFHDLLLLRGLPVYPLALASGIMAVALGAKSQCRSDRIAASSMVAILVVVVWRFVSLGVLRAALEIR